MEEAVNTSILHHESQEFLDYQQKIFIGVEECQKIAEQKKERISNSSGIFIEINSGERKSHRMVLLKDLIRKGKLILEKEFSDWLGRNSQIFPESEFKNLKIRISLYQDISNFPAKKSQGAALNEEIEPLYETSNIPEEIFPALDPNITRQNLLTRLKTKLTTSPLDLAMDVKLEELKLLSALQGFLEDGSEKLSGYILEEDPLSRTKLWAILMRLFDTQTLILLPKGASPLKLKREFMSLGFDEKTLGVLHGDITEFGRKFTIMTWLTHNTFSKKEFSTHKRNLPKIQLLLCHAGGRPSDQVPSDSLPEAVIPLLPRIQKDSFTSKIDPSVPNSLKYLSRDLPYALQLGFCTIPPFDSKEIQMFFEREIHRVTMDESQKSGIFEENLPQRIKAKRKPHYLKNHS